MAKKQAAKNVQPRAKVVRPVRAKPSVAAVKAAAKIVTDAAQEQPTAIWEVLSPFKFRGSVVKPPAWIELSDEEAKLYQAAGVLGTEPGEVPDTDASADESAADAAARDSAVSATDGQGSNGAGK